MNPPEALSAPQTAEQAPEGSRTAKPAPEAVTQGMSGLPEAPEATANPAPKLTARQRIAALLWWSVPGSTDDEAKAHAGEMLDEYAAEVRAERDGEVTAWLVKKAREFHASSRKREREQGDTCAVLASKIARGAVRPNNTLMLPNPGFFEVDRTYEYAPLHILFRCDAIGVHPVTGEPSAVGWIRYRGGGWSSGDYSPAEYADGWTEVTEPKAVQS